MNHADHVDLLKNGISEPGGVWADLGAGTGAFTLALAELIGPAGQIYAVDKDRSALRQLEGAMKNQFSGTMLRTYLADFTKPLDLPPLHGIVMANSLHFLRQKESVLRQIRGYLRPAGRLILIEYDTDSGNYWVPHPLSYATWSILAAQAGFSHTTLLATKPSRFLGRIFAAVSIKNTS